MTTSNYGRGVIAWPDLGSPAGAPLHAEVTNGIAKISNNLLGRWSGSQTLIASGTYNMEHNFSLSLANLRVRVYTSGFELSEIQAATTITITQISVNEIQVTNISGSSLTIQVYVEPIRRIRKEDLDPNIDIIIEQLSTVAHNDTISGTAVTAAAATTSYKRLTAAGTLVSLAGLTAPSPSENRLMVVSNLTGVSISILNENAGATATNRVVTGTGSDLTLADASNLLLIYDTASTRWRIVGGSGGGGLDPVEVNSSITAVANKAYLVDTSAGAVTITLPAGAPKASISFLDAKETWGTNNLIIDPNGSQKIDGLPDGEELIMDVSGGWVQLTWDSVNTRWVVQAPSPGSVNTAIINGGQSLGADITIGTNDAFGLNLETNGTTKLAISSAGAVTLGAASDTPYTTFHTTNKSIFASTPSSATDLNGTIRIGSNSYSAAGNQPTRVSGLTGGQIVWLNRTSDVDSFFIQMNKAADSTTTAATTILSATSAGAWTIGPNSPGSSVLHKIDGYNASTGGGAGLQIFNRATNTGSAATEFIKGSADSTTSHRLVVFTINNGVTGSGQINANGAGAAAFGTFSDSRLKENIENLPAQLANILSLRPVEFDYISGGHQVGFIAQEMQQVYPDAIGAEEDTGMLTITGWDKTSARLVKAIQELKQELDDTKSQLTALQQQVNLQGE